MSNALVGQVALFHQENQSFELMEAAVRPLKPAELLVKNLYVTICGSDVHTYCGHRHEPSPTVLGHEIVGELIDWHPDHRPVDLQGNTLTKGDIITWTIFASDPNSIAAIEGMPQKGDHLFKYGHALAQGPELFHGGMATHCILKPNTGILKVAPQIPLSVAATINCSVATVAGALRMAGNVQYKNILIMGVGHLGITCAAMSKTTGARTITACDVSTKRLQQSVDFGVDRGFNLDKQKEECREYLKQLPGGVDIVFDMSGHADAMEFGLEVLGLGGTAVWIGAVFAGRKVEVDAEKIIRKIITIKGLHNYNFEDFRNAVEFMRAHHDHFPFEKAIEKEFTLSEVAEAFAFASQAKPLRAGIDLRQTLQP